MNKKYSTLRIETSDKSEILQQVQSALQNFSQVELDFPKKPAPREFKDILLYLQNNVSVDDWFLSERDGVIAGVLFNLNYSRPRRAVVEIANGCNLKCDFCWTHSPLLETPPDAKWLKKTLPTEVICNYLDELAAYDTVRLVEFCAIGDPLYHPDIWNLIKHAKSKNFELRLSTNGTLLYPDKWDKYCDVAPVNELFMNISAGDRDTYADIHNVSPKIYDQLIVNLKHINAVRKQKKQLLSMRWINIITEKNIGNIDQIIDSGVEAGADYIDFRYVWVHKEFQKNIGVTQSSLINQNENLLRIPEKIKSYGIESNFSDFYSSVFKTESTHVG